MWCLKEVPCSHVYFNFYCLLEPKALNVDVSQSGVVFAQFFQRIPMKISLNSHQAEASDIRSHVKQFDSRQLEGVVLILGINVKMPGLFSGYCWLLRIYYGIGVMWVIWNGEEGCKEIR